MVYYTIGFIFELLMVMKCNLDNQFRKLYSKQIGLEDFC